MKRRRRNPIGLIALASHASTAHSVAGVLRKRNLNPDRREQVAQAANRFEAFTGMPATKMRGTRVRVPKVAMLVGTMTAIAYSTIRDGKRYNISTSSKNPPGRYWQSVLTGALS